MKTNCDVIRDLLPLYAEHITSEATNALVEEHLAECEVCRAELEQMEQPVLLLFLNSVWKGSRMRPCAGSGPPCKEGASVQRSALCWQPCALWQ